MTFHAVNVSLTTSAQVLYECGATAQGSAHSIVLSSAASVGRTATLQFYDHSSGVTSPLVTNVTLTQGNLWSFPKPINLNAGDKILGLASDADVTAFVGVYLSGSSTLNNSLNPVGAWNSGATYQRLDMVSYNDNSYIALSASTNDPPPSGNWMLVAAKGIGASAADVAFTPTGSISATNIQAAIVEVAAEGKTVLPFYKADNTYSPISLL